ncbi:uncharacterized protein LOC135495149 [Lineus longissimus]|uniref:uncharacterized protein LOC135495149 n=1 Tax=Lineus longissimus TaxID=88925 RepID=UPI00315DBD69
MANFNHVTFSKLADDFAFVDPEPDFGSQSAISGILCALLCIFQDECLLVSVIRNENLCQWSRKGGACVRKTDVFRLSMSRIYEKKVKHVVKFTLVRKSRVIPPVISRLKSGSIYMYTSTKNYILVLSSSIIKSAATFNIIVYRYNKNNEAFIKAYDTTTNKNGGTSIIVGSFFQNYLLAVRMKTSTVLLYDVVRGYFGGKIDIPAQDRCRRLVDIRSMMFNFGNGDQNAAVCCMSTRIRKMSITVYDVKVTSHRGKVWVKFVSPKLMRPNGRQTRKTVMKMDSKFILDADILLMISYKEKHIDVFHFRQSNGYKPERNNIKPPMASVALIGNSKFGSTLLVHHNNLIGLFEIFCRFKDSISKKKYEAMLKRVNPVLTFKMKVKGKNIELIMGMNMNRNLVFLDAEYDKRQKHGQMNQIVRTVLIYRESP